jgi:hypothetical protein
VATRHIMVQTVGAIPTRVKSTKKVRKDKPGGVRCQGNAVCWNSHDET